MIGQFSGPYSPLRTFVLLQNCFVGYRQVKSLSASNSSKLFAIFPYSKLFIKRLQIDSFRFRGAQEI